MKKTESKNQQIMILGRPAYLRVSFFGVMSLAVIACCFTAQVHAQGLSGVVTASFSRQPVWGAELRITGNDSTLYTATTDSLGRYVCPIARADRYLVEIKAEGYLPLYISDVILDGYRTQQLDPILEKTSWSLPEVTVTSTMRHTTPYIRTITPDDLVQVAGNYDDPVRAALSDPGMISLNDQANHFSARGKSPVFNTWQLEGLDIVNPNHTNNAGTFSDLPTQYGGGVSMFSAQTLGATDLYMGINPMQVNNVSGASTDMHLHESATPEWRAKAGLLGMELGGGAALGDHSILDVNLRYSFTGILTALGADFGGERISYYDGVVSYRQQQERYALKVFAWYGYSENLFDHPTDTAEIETYKDFFDIDYGNSILGAGATYDHTLGDKINFHTGAALSTNESTYYRSGTFETHEEYIDDADRITLFSSFAEVTVQHSSRFKSLAGLNFKNRTYQTDDVNVYSYLPFPEESMLRPYINTSVDLSRTMRLELGGDLSWSILYASLDPGYRASLRWNYGDRSSVFAGVRHGAGEQVLQYSRDDEGHHLRNTFLEAGWSLSGVRHAFTVDVYSHRMYGLLRLDLTDGYIHLADYPFTATTALPNSFTTSANAHYYGAEAQWEYRHLGWRVFVNQSLYRSDRDTDTSEGDAQGRYNGQYATHVVLAREIIREKNGKSRIWNIGLRGMWHGGLWEQAIDLDASEQYYTTVYSNSGEFDRRIPDYRRLDFTIVRTVGSRKVRWRYALDIQNVLGLTNVAYTYYDPYLKTVANQEQLGLIPVLSVQASW